MAGLDFRLHGASVRFASVAALTDIDLSITAGERVALLGPSGSGKSTLLRLLNGTQRPGAGRVEVAGRDIGALGRGRLRALRARIGFVHQQLDLVPNLRVSQNVLAGRLGHTGFLGALRLLLRAPRRDLEEAWRVLERVGIGEKLFERTDKLSGGQQQRVALDRALLQQPDAQLADEPVSSVDPARARDTIELLTSISREEGLTLVASLHDAELARTAFDRLVALRGGRIVFDRPADDVQDGDMETLYRLSAAEMLADGA